MHRFKFFSWLGAALRVTAFRKFHPRWGALFGVICGLSAYGQTALSSGEVGVPYQVALIVFSGVNPPYTACTVTGNPPGLVVSLVGGNCQISGIPTTAGNYALSVAATNSANATTSMQLTISVLPALSISTSSLPNGQVNVPYSAPLVAVGGQGTYNWSGSGLPSGLAVSTTGTVSGTPTAAGLFSFTASVMDGLGGLVSKALSLVISPGGGQGRIITTIAGNGATGFSGDGGPATSATLGVPERLVVDSGGALYIADPLDNRVRKVSGGTITTIAGNGTLGFSGDGGPATSAALSGPLGLAVDSAGNLYIADSSNGRIRKVSGGIITTVAGNGAKGGFDNSGDFGPATSAQLYFPTGVAVDSAGILYIADSESNRIRKVSNGVITPIAGNLSSGFSGDGGPAANATLNNPLAVAVDSAGNIYVDDAGNQRIREISAESGIITTVAGSVESGFSGDGGPATSAALGGPRDVAVDSAGNLYIVDLATNRIRMVSKGIITTFAGNGTAGFSGDGGLATSASLNSPAGVAVDSAGNIYISDASNGRIREVLLGAPSPLQISPAALSFSTTVGGFSLSSTVSVSSSASGQSFSATTTSKFLSINPSSGSTPASLQITANPAGLAAGAYTGLILISDAVSNTVVPVTLVVNGPPCTPTKLLIAVTSGTSYTAGFPTTVTVVVANDCGAPVNSGSVLMSFNNGDPPIGLVSQGNGNWSGSFAVGNVQPQLSVNVVATTPLGSGMILGTTQVTFSLATGSSNPPAILGITDSASFVVRSLAPGSFFSIFGSNLANSSSAFSGVPVPTTLAGTSVFINSKAIPLFYASPGQINAIVPYGLPASTSQQLIIQRGSTFGTPTTVQIAAADPGVFTVTQSGTGAGAILNQDGTLNTASNPAPRGSVVSIYCAGLGAVTPQVADGAVPASLTTTTNQVVVGINNTSVPVLFAGLAPGFVGLYQVNAMVPSSTPIGSAIPVQLGVIVSGQTISSPTVTMAVQ